MLREISIPDTMSLGVIRVKRDGDNYCSRSDVGCNDMVKLLPRETNDRTRYIIIIIMLKKTGVYIIMYGDCVAERNLQANSLSVPP